MTDRTHTSTLALDGFPPDDEPIRIATTGPGYALVPAELARDHEVSDGAVRLYGIIAAFYGPSGNGAIPSDDVLAAAMRVTPTKLRRLAGELTARGWNPHGVGP